jgi:hypothetical protein
MPSLGENSPYVVYECLELGIPFLASTRGGAAELIAADDRSHALTDPEPDQIAAALERASCQGVSPVRAAFAAEASLESWRAIVEADVPVREGSRPRRMNVDVVETPGTLATTAEWVLLLTAGVAPSVNLVDTLARAQEATDADVVTCGIDIASDGVTFLFQGDAGGLGVLANRFGTVALLRRELLRDEHVAGASADPVWPLLAELSMAGAAIVSIPEPLAIAAAAPGDLRSAPADGAAVARLYERRLGGAFKGLALLATVGASADGAGSASPRVRGAYRTLGRAMASTVGRGARRLAR